MYVFPDKEGLFLDMICLLSKALGLDEGVKLDHGLRVAQLSQAIAKQLNHDTPDQLFIAGLLHDIGGMGLDDHILHHALKSFQDMEAREHATRGADILHSFQPFHPFVAWVADHHERYDGTGFPVGKSKLGISSEAGILHLADILDLFVRDNPQPTLTEIRNFLNEQSATSVPPAIVEAGKRLLSLPENIVLLTGVISVHELCSGMDLRLPGIDLISAQELLCQLLWLTAQVADCKVVGRSFHSNRVAFYSHRIALAFSCDEVEPLQLLWAGLLHDIGMTAIPRNDLRKEWNISSGESSPTMSHAQISAELVSQVEGLAHLAPVLAAHHEYWDGSGAPEGLLGKEIPLMSQIVSVADYYDILAGEVQGGARLHHQHALQQLEKGRGQLFAPELLDRALPVLKVWGARDISWLRGLSNVYAFFTTDPFEADFLKGKAGQLEKKGADESENFPRPWAFARMTADFTFLEGAEVISTLAGMDGVENLSDVIDISMQGGEIQGRLRGLAVGDSLTRSLAARNGKPLELIFIRREDEFELLSRGINEAPLFARKQSLFYRNFSNTSEAELLLDQEGVIRDANLNALKLLGFSLGELQGKGIGSLFSPFLSKAKSHSLQLFFDVEGEDVWSEEFPLVNGEGRHCSLQVTLERLGRGDILQMTCLCRLKDVLEQKKVEQDMIHRDRALQLIIHNTSGMTGEKFFRSLLHQFTMLIRSRIAFVGEIVDEGMAIRPLAYWQYGNFQDKGQFTTQGTPCRLVAKRGEIFFPRRLREFFPQDPFLLERDLNSYWGLPLRRQDGSIIGVLVALDEKKIVRSKNTLAIVKVLQSLAGNELARLQTERILQENEEQLEMQNRELLRMNQLKSDMIAVTSHDLKSPLSAIIGYASLLEQYFSTLTEEKKIYYIKRIEKEGQKQLVFINKLLDLYRIESGAIELELESQRLDLLVEGCVENQRHVAGAHGIDIIFSVEGKPMPLLVDRSRMDQVFSNLLSNAVKFSPEKGTIAVRYSQDEHSVAVEVCDHGEGIDEEEITNIFDRYYMGRTNFDVRPEGAGLGLYIVKNIISLHGGDVSACNRKNGGSCFTVQIPVQNNGTINE